MPSLLKPPVAKVYIWRAITAVYVWNSPPVLVLGSQYTPCAQTLSTSRYYANVIAPFFNPTLIVSFAANLPSSNAFDSGFSISC